MKNNSDTQVHSAPSLQERAGGESLRHLIVLADGMADWHVPELDGKTLLQHADTPAMDWLAAYGRTGMLTTVPEGFHPGSEVANSSILGYDQHIVYEGRGPLEAAAIGVDLEPDDFAMRCNFVCIQGDILKNHSCGRLETEEADPLIHYLNENLASDPRYGGRVRFYTGVQYRHLLVIKGGNKNIHCTPPHDIPLQTWRDKMPSPLPASSDNRVGETPAQTAALLCDLIQRSQELLPLHIINATRAREGKDMASSIWPWGGGYRPQMLTLADRFPQQVHRGAVITAVDLIRGIGRYAGLDVINVPGATGLYDTNYEGKAQAAIDAFRSGYDFVYLHVEAADEAGHDGSIPLKLRTIEDLDHRLLQPILTALAGEALSIALLPDHPTPCAHRTHTAEPVPFCIYYPGIEPDDVQTFDEDACRHGAYGHLQGDEFIKLFIGGPSPDHIRPPQKRSASAAQGRLTLSQSSSSFATPVREGGKEPSHFYRTASPDIYSKLREFAHDNRREATLAEDILWQELRKNQMGVRFRRQHPIGDYIADFICLPLKLVIEVDGGYHNAPSQTIDDQQRTDWLKDKGYIVLRFTNEEVAYDTSTVITKIQQQINQIK